MAYHDKFRLSVHAVILNDEKKVLQLKATYQEKRWGLPGGSLDVGETIHQALLRGCREEIGIDVKILYLSGVYYHQAYDSHVCIFKCAIPPDSKIILSEEHSDYAYFPLEELNAIQRHRIEDCLNFNGTIKSACF